MGKKAKKKRKKEIKTRLIFETENEELSEMEDNDDDLDEGGILLDKGSVQIIYNALREYKPAEKEAHLHGILLEEFEETLVAEYGEPYPDAN